MVRTNANVVGAFVAEVQQLRVTDYLARRLLHKELTMVEPLLFSGVVMGSMLVTLAAARSVLGVALHLMGAENGLLTSSRRETVSQRI